MTIVMLRSLANRPDRLEGVAYTVTPAEGADLIARGLAYDQGSPGPHTPVVVELKRPLTFVWDVSGPTAQPVPPGVEWPIG